MNSPVAGATAVVADLLRTQRATVRFDAATLTWSAADPAGPCPTTRWWRILAEEQQFLFAIVAEVPAWPHKVAEVLDFIARANCGMRIGCFEFYHGDLKLRFRSGLGFRGDRLSAALVTAATAPAEDAFATYLPGFLDVVAGVASSVEAINRIEHGT